MRFKFWERLKELIIVRFATLGALSTTLSLFIVRFFCQGFIKVYRLFVASWIIFNSRSGSFIYSTLLVVDKMSGLQDCYFIFKLSCNFVLSDMDSIRCGIWEPQHYTLFYFIILMMITSYFRLFFCYLPANNMYFCSTTIKTICLLFRHN